MSWAQLSDFTFTFHFPALEKEMATHSSVFRLLEYTLEYAPVYSRTSCLENPRDRGAWWASVYGVAQSWTRLKRLSQLPPVLRNSCLLIYLIIAS